ncbi:MAG: polyphosphate kinase 1 [Bacteroidales bacterium]|nr:polyphosphate kinase 1 [Bacteroidales bacterium]
MTPRIKPQMLNREIAWLYFNGRVLQEAADKENPLIERLKFLGIFSNNRDEFFRVRVATLNRLLEVERGLYDTAINPKKVLNEIGEIVLSQEKEFQNIFESIVKEFAEHDIHIINEQQLSPKQGEFVRKYFQEQVRVFLFPLMISSFKDISTLVDKSIYLAVHLESSEPDTSPDYALIEVPTKSVSRFLLLPKEGKKQYVMLLDDVIRFCLSEIFFHFGYDTYNAYTVKVTRDAELDIDIDISKSFLEVMAESLKQRKQGTPVRFVYDNSMPKELLTLLRKKLNIRKDDPIRGGGRYHNFKDFTSFPDLGHPELENRPLPPQRHPDINPNTSIISLVKQKDIMLHFPYQTFRHVIDLLREASIDPQVRSIKMTIYRAARNSSVINAMINAARNGKYVTVYMELQARFDEEANIYWAERLHEEGVKVIRSIPGFKVHSKLLLIRRKENSKNVFYSMISTGNFNEDTARIYADDSLLTADPRICQDVANAFHQIESAYKPYRYKSLILAPFNMRNHFVRLLNQEIRNAKAGKEAWAIIKLNNLVDETIVKKLYKASQAGVQIKLIIRGICVPIPGISGVSENIEGISIVDRFLEHSRVIVFCNDNDPLFYITSADWMIRNFDNRIEVACPIYDESIKNDLWEMLQIQLSDNTKARTLGEEKPNAYRRSKGPKVRSQEAIYDYLTGEV